MKIVGCRFSSARVVVLTPATVPAAWTQAANDAGIGFPAAPLTARS